MLKLFWFYFFEFWKLKNEIPNNNQQNKNLNKNWKKNMFKIVMLKLFEYILIKKKKRTKILNKELIVISTKNTKEMEIKYDTLY